MSGTVLDFGCIGDGSQALDDLAVANLLAGRSEPLSSAWLLRIRPGEHRESTASCCRARTKAGKACKAIAVKRGLCAFYADPQRAARLGRMGGRKNRRYPSSCKPDAVPPPRTAREVKDLLAEALADIHAGRREPKVVSVMAYVGTALLNAIKTADMEERIAALERSSKRE